MPEAVKWHRVYCGVLLFMWAVVFPIWIVAATSQTSLWDGMMSGARGAQFDDIFRSINDQRRAEVDGIRLLLFGCSAVLSSLAVIALTIKPSPGAWVYHIFMQCIGLSGGCTLPFAVLLLINWFSPQVKTYFGKSETASPSLAPPAVSDPSPPIIPH